MVNKGAGSIMRTAVLALLMIASVLGEQQTSTISQSGNGSPDGEAKKRPQDSYVHDRGDLEKYQDDLHEEEARLSPEPYGELGRLLSNVYKRASMRGFQGMRGKKSEYEAQSYPSLEELYVDKKAPMGFQGMRGKKTALDELAYLDDALDKRAPYSAFQGVRGKKSFEEVLSDELDKRARMAGFQGMRGKKSEEYDDELQQAALEWQKRAPQRGFQGMRGRKSVLEEFDDELVKRALSSFHGMRGKKDMLYEPEDVSNYMEKRPMMMSFHGMRGKRSADYYDGAEAASRFEKRSPYRFFGSRGKKNPRWESRAKGFVGVRGKRLEAPRQLPWPVSIYDELELAAAAEDLSMPERH